MADLNSWEEDPAAQDDNLSRQTQQMNLNQQGQAGGSFRPAAATFHPGAQSFQPGQAYSGAGAGGQGGYVPQYYGGQGYYPQYGGAQGGFEQYGQGYGGVYGQQAGYNQGYNQGYGIVPSGSLRP